MKFKCLFVNHRKQKEIPEGWIIDTVMSSTPKNGKPEFMVLLKKEIEKKESKASIGFRTSCKSRK